MPNYNNIVKREYYKLKCKTSSPMKIGSGISGATDSDIIKDSKNDPYIPASTIAGCFRDYLDHWDWELGGVFGSDNQSEMKQSNAIVYDGYFIAPKIGIRTNVQLENRVAVEKSLFDYEYINKDTEFYLQFQVQYFDNSKNYEEQIKRLLTGIHNQEIYFGGKTTRGFGQFELLEVEKKTFDWKNSQKAKEAYNEWLSWNKSEFETWLTSNEILDNCKDYKDSKEALYKEFIICLEQKSPLMVREESLEKGIDTTMMTEGDEVILPATTLMGALREYFDQYGKDFDETEYENRISRIFGYVTEEENQTSAKRSKVRIQDIYMKKKLQKYTRNRIDRFTGGVVPGALFTEKIQLPTNEKLELIIKYKKDPKDENDLEFFEKVLANYLDDLNRGFLTIGGEATIGRGRFSYVSSDPDLSVGGGVK